jgi:hypothetical protein
MTPRRIHELAACAVGRPRSEAELNRWLQAQGITDPETRMAVKHQMMAQGLATDEQPPLGTLRTDLSRHTPETAPMGAEVARLFRRANLEPGRAYSTSEVEDALARCTMGIEDRLAVKAEMGFRGWLRAAGARPAMSAGRDMSASAERPRGKVLLDKSGKPAVLRSQPA